MVGCLQTTRFFRVNVGDVLSVTCRMFMGCRNGGMVDTSGDGLCDVNAQVLFVLIYSSCEQVANGQIQFGQHH